MYNISLEKFKDNRWKSSAQSELHACVRHNRHVKIKKIA